MNPTYKSTVIGWLLILGQFGIDPLRFRKVVKSLPRLFRDWWAFRKAFRELKTGDFAIPMRFYPQLGDIGAGAGEVANHYFQMDLCVAQLVCAAKPERHVDVGSRIDGFVAHVASSQPIEILDIRPLEGVTIKNISFQQADLMDESNEWEKMASESVSCLHALEHFGLGRYGDSIDPLAHERGLRNLTRLVKENGVFYLAVPVSVEPRIEFNAHRVFSFPHLRSMVAGAFEFESVAVVDDQGMLQTRLAWDNEAANSSWNCRYGCVIMVLRKKPVMC